MGCRRRGREVARLVADPDGYILCFSELPGSTRRMEERAVAVLPGDDLVAIGADLEPGTLVTAYPGRPDTAHTIRLTKRALEFGAEAYFIVQPLFGGDVCAGGDSARRHRFADHLQAYPSERSDAADRQPPLA